LVWAFESGTVSGAFLDDAMLLVCSFVLRFNEGYAAWFAAPQKPGPIPYVFSLNFLFIFHNFFIRAAAKWANKKFTFGSTQQKKKKMREEKENKTW